MPRIASFSSQAFTGFGLRPDIGLDFSGFSYSNNSFDVVDAPGVSPPMRRSSVKHVRFNTDGTKMYILADRDDLNIDSYLYEYVLNTPYDITSAIYNRTEDQLINENVAGLVILPIEGYLFLTTGSEIQRRDFNESNFSVSSSPRDETLSTDRIETLALNADGTRFYTVVKAGNNEYTINQYSMSNPYNLFSLALQNSFTTGIGVSQFNTAPKDIFLNDDESKLFMTIYSGNQSFNQFARQLSMNPPGDISTLSSEESLNHTNEGLVANSFAFEPTGKKVFLLMDGVVYEYSK